MEIWDYVLLCVEENQRREGRHRRGKRGDKLERREWDPSSITFPQKEEEKRMLKSSKNGRACLSLHKLFP